MFILASISSGLEFWSVNRTSIFEIFENTKFFGERSSNWLNDLLGTNVYKTLESCC